MKRCHILGQTVIWITLLATIPALAQWDLTCHYDPIKGGPVSVYTVPDGTGDPLSNAYQWDGVVGHPPVRVDATITYTLLAYDTPVYGYPNEDMWLATSLGGLVLCPGGSTADRDTDMNGQTTFSKRLFAGGASAPDAGELCVVYVSGFICPNEGLDIQFNSPDITGDRMVNLSDVVLFSQIMFGAYDYAADFYWDGVVNLSDVVLLAQAMGATCP